jgi:hypothetical protein
MTTWHENEPFEEAPWYFLACTFPGDELVEPCRCRLVITIGQPDLAVLARDAAAAWSGGRARSGKHIEFHESLVQAIAPKVEA